MWGGGCRHELWDGIFCYGYVWILIYSCVKLWSCESWVLEIMRCAMDEITKPASPTTAKRGIAASTGSGMGPAFFHGLVYGFQGWVLGERDGLALSVRFVRVRVECWTRLVDESDVSAVAVLRRRKYVIVLPFPCRHDEVGRFRARHRLLRPEYYRSSQRVECRRIRRRGISGTDEVVLGGVGARILVLWLLLRLI